MYETTRTAIVGNTMSEFNFAMTAVSVEGLESKFSNVVTADWRVDDRRPTAIDTWSIE